MNIGEAQLKPEAVTGYCCGQHAQKSDHSEYMTANALSGTPKRPSENAAEGSVSGWAIRRHKTQPIEKQ